MDAIFEVDDTLLAVKKEIERYMSLQFMANTPTFVSKLDSDGYLSLAYLSSQKSIKDYNLDLNTIIKIIQSIDALSLSPDEQGVRISLPVARKTLILRDIPEKTTEEMICTLFEHYTIETIKKEVACLWYITFTSEEVAMQACEDAQSKTIEGQLVKCRIKSEYYMNVFMRRLQSAMTIKNIEKPTRKMSINARPFIMPNGFVPTIHVAANDIDDSISSLGACWSEPTISPNYSFDLFNSTNSSENGLPFVATESIHDRYLSSFIHYSSEEILGIARSIVDLSMPPIATPGDHSIAIMDDPNVELVEKGRTMSIDQAYRVGMPRSYSVDSVDYTCMLEGDMDEDVIEVVRKQRKSKNRRRTNGKLNMND